MAAAAMGQFGFAEAGVTLPSLEVWARQRDQELIAALAVGNSVDTQVA